MPRVAVLDDYQQVATQFADWSVLDGRADITVFHDTLHDEDALVERLAPFEIIAGMRERTPFPRSLIERLPNLKLLITTGMRNRSFDLAALREHGIAVSGTPSGHDTTSEMTWCLILALARNLVQENRSVRAGGWQTTVGRAMHGSVLGLVGLGRIGANVAAVAKAFGMTVIAWSPNLTDERCEGLGVTRVDKHTLFETADFVSIHMVLSDRTRGLVGNDDIKRMKLTAYLVNTSRGPLVNEAALIAALQSKTIAGAGLDTFDREPLPPDHPFRTLETALATPHLGYVSVGSYQSFYKAIVENIVAYLNGQIIRPLDAA